MIRANGCLLPRTIKNEEWLLGAIQLMARTGCSLIEAAIELQVVLSSEEAKTICRRSSFNRFLWEERHRYFSDLGNDPNFKKDTAIGKLLTLAQKLEETGEYDKASEVLFKVAKMSGWVGPESTVSVFGELSQRDMDAIRDKIAKDSLNKRIN